MEDDTRISTAVRAGARAGRAACAGAAHPRRFRPRQGRADASPRPWGRLGETVWPGAPLWQPACALALSLMIGLGVAAFAPLDPPQDDGLFAFDVGIGQGV